MPHGESELRNIQNFLQKWGIIFRFTIPCLCGFLNNPGYVIIIRYRRGALKK